ncbi:hypothetical protein COEREDRAFT_85544 [Coemansia reversa NRRL 1564]|uniref:SWR1-complex protein 5 n=1 Tax=Coemansia reversa (strain ATCC 12441 / NRRL 1564) TaxID=763665 RepID=A0A2G5BGF3_COERN|nr:hypothetical protein COEREDRAFT_85544 [Coemansia reversa NRRL 1564]|eukprot:PIA18081.1 hypothetical protein COEREDRAFT_85544 [Coemansia reversa NRRL 1564]
MSLADLYKDDRELGSEDSEGSEEDFVPSEAPSDEDEEDDDASGGEQQTAISTKEEGELQQQNKRRIDAIWLEMNTPSSSSRKAMRAAADDDKSQQTGEKSPPPVDKVENADIAVATETTNKTPAADKVAAKAPPRRKASKFSKLVEQSEQRRAKKANTLDTARKSWSGFVATEGIREDLEKANKDGYIERQEFLGRVDQRTFQRSKELRK